MIETAKKEDDASKFIGKELRFKYGNPVKGDILVTGDKVKILSKDQVSVYDKESKEWENYKFDEIFPDGFDVKDFNQTPKKSEAKKE